MTEAEELLARLHNAPRYVAEPTPTCSNFPCAGTALRSDRRGRCGPCVRMARALEKRDHHERVVAAVEALTPGQGLELPIAGKKKRRCEFLRGAWLMLDRPTIFVRFWTAQGEEREREVRAELLLEHGYAAPTAEDKLCEEIAKVLSKCLYCGGEKHGSGLCPVAKEVV